MFDPNSKAELIFFLQIVGPEYDIYIAARITLLGVHTTYLTTARPRFISIGSDCTLVRWANT